jgi:hypothetical protein
MTSFDKIEEELEEHELVNKYVSQPLRLDGWIDEFDGWASDQITIEWLNDVPASSVEIEFTALRLALLDLGYDVEDRDGRAGFNILLD